MADLRCGIDMGRWLALKEHRPADLYVLIWGRPTSLPHLGFLIEGTIRCPRNQPTVRLLLVSQGIHRDVNISQYTLGLMILVHSVVRLSGTPYRTGPHPPDSERITSMDVWQRGDRTNREYSIKQVIARPALPSRNTSCSGRSP